MFGRRQYSAGPGDLLNAEESVIDGDDQRVVDAADALSGWLSVENYVDLDPAFVQAVKLQHKTRYIIPWVSGIFSDLDIASVQAV